MFLEFMKHEIIVQQQVAKETWLINNLMGVDEIIRLAIYAILLPATFPINLAAIKVASSGNMQMLIDL